MKTRIVAKISGTGRTMYWPQYKRFWMWWNFKGKNGGKVFLIGRKDARNWIRSKATVVEGNIHTVFE
jgi:hypothetical protein